MLFFKSKSIVYLILCFFVVAVVIGLSAGYAYAEGDSDQQTDPAQLYKQLISQEQGSVFDKIVANFIGGIASFLTSVQSNIVGFKTLDALLYNKGVTDEIPPFDKSHWDKMKSWYTAMESIAGIILLIAVGYTAYKFIATGFNPQMREEAMDSLKRLFFSVIIILLAPTFVEVMFRLNNIMVAKLADTIGADSLDSYLGATGEYIKTIRTGNAVTTALVLLMFAYINFKLNILFLIRYFVITVFYIFTPIVAVMWAMNKTVNAASIWIGEMISNAFMQFVYAFVFSIYLSFAGRGISWATAFIWAFLLLSIAEVLRNSVQSLYTRLSGLNEGAEASKILGFLGIGGLASAGQAISGQFGTIAGPGGSLIAKIGTAVGTAGGALGTAGSFMASATNFEGRPAGEESTVTSGDIGSATQPVNTSTVGISAQIGAQQMPKINGPTGGVINRVSTLANTLDAFNIAGHTAERFIGTMGTIAAAGGGREGIGLVQGAGRIANMTLRGIGGIAGIGYAVNKYAREHGISKYQALREITGADFDKSWKGHVRTAWRTLNIAASNTFSGNETLRQKLMVYHATSIDGMRFK